MYVYALCTCAVNIHKTYARARSAHPRHRIVNTIATTTFPISTHTTTQLASDHSTSHNHDDDHHQHHDDGNVLGMLNLLKTVASGL